MRAKSMKRFARNKSGAAAIEFAIVAPVFFALMFSIFEAGTFYFLSSSVESANTKAARLIRTGQAQGVFSKEQYFEEVCKVVRPFGDCNKNLTVQVSQYGNFSELAADITAPTCTDANDSDIAGLSYNGGGSREIIRVRVCYLKRTITPGIGLRLDHTGDGRAKIVSNVIFRNEPFQSE